ncbi:hypothetical protein LXL04_034272 [Taraxacum kok-saghyz]
MRRIPLSTAIHEYGDRGQTQSSKAKLAREARAFVGLRLPLLEYLPSQFLCSYLFPLSRISCGVGQKNSSFYKLQRIVAAL